MRSEVGLADERGCVAKKPLRLGAAGGRRGGSPYYVEGYRCNSRSLSGLACWSNKSAVPGGGGDSMEDGTERPSSQSHTLVAAGSHGGALAGCLAPFCVACRRRSERRSGSWWVTNKLVFDTPERVNRFRFDLGGSNPFYM